MKLLREILTCALLVALLVVGSDVHQLLVDAVPLAISGVPAQIGATRAALITEVQATRRDLLAEVDKQASGIRHDAVVQAAALRGDTMARVDTLTAALDKRTGDALQIADSRLSGAVGTIEGMREDLKPILSGSAALVADSDKAVQDLKDSWDANYDDIHATIESSTVAVTGVARAAEAVGNAAPGTAKSFESISASVEKEAAALTKPQTFWQGLKSWLLVVSRCAGFFL
jgi:hypothetical protein